MGRRPGSWLAAMGAVAIRPRLWPAALRSARAVTPPGWWRRAPFVPRPDAAYLAFRLETQYGADGAPSARDLVSYLDWCTSQRRIMRGGRS
jgi:hypothetical protein